MSSLCFTRGKCSVPRVLWGKAQLLKRAGSVRGQRLLCPGLCGAEQWHRQQGQLVCRWLELRGGAAVGSSAAFGSGVQSWAVSHTVVCVCDVIATDTLSTAAEPSSEGFCPVCCPQNCSVCAVAVQLAGPRCSLGPGSAGSEAGSCSTA